MLFISHNNVRLYLRAIFPGTVLVFLGTVGPFPGAKMLPGKFGVFLGTTDGCRKRKSGGTRDSVTPDKRKISAPSFLAINFPLSAFSST
jgi:hypothetical protein